MPTFLSWTQNPTSCRVYDAKTTHTVPAIPSPYIPDVFDQRVDVSLSPPMARPLRVHTPDAVRTALDKQMERARDAYLRDTECKEALTAKGYKYGGSEPFDPTLLSSVSHDLKSGGKCVGVTHLGRRAANEDAFLVCSGAVKGVPYDFFAVLDGHGARDGKNEAVACVKEWLPGQLDAVLQAAGDDDTLLWHHLKTVFEPIQDLFARREIPHGTTVTGVLKRGTDAWVIQLGDSAAEYHAPDGSVIPLTEEASPEDPSYRKGAVARGGIVWEDPFEYEGKEYVLDSRLVYRDTAGFLRPSLNMARSFGDPHILGVSARAKITRFVWKEGKVILMSDGMFPTHSREEVSGWIRDALAAGGDDWEKGVSAAVERAFEEKSPDNISLMVVGCGPSPAAGAGGAASGAGR